VSTVGELPVGTVTFLFTDVEGSTQLLKQLRDRYGEALEDHQRILREVFAEHGGHEIDTQGDSFFVAFRRAKDAVAAAIACQHRLRAHAWPDDRELKVRMGIHTGEPSVGGARYVGLGVHRAARICAAGHGGQILVSQTTRELLRDDPVPEVSLRDLGEHQLKDLDEPERLYQLIAPGLQEEFPPLKTAASTPFEGREGELAQAAAVELTKRWRRPGRRVLIGATSAAAAVGVGLGVLLTQGGGSEARASIAPNAVGVIDAETGRIASEVPVGRSPGEIAAGEGAIWVTNASDNTVSRIDPSSNDVVQTIDVGNGPAGIAVGEGSVWVANGFDGTVSRINIDSNDVVQTITVGNGPNGVAFGQDAVWVTNSADGTVSRITPADGKVTNVFPAVVGASGIAVGAGRVWIASPSSATVVALNAKSGRVVSRVGVGAEPDSLAFGAGALWVANRAAATVSKIGPEIAAVVDTVEVGRGPDGIAASAESVWVANGRDRTLSRIDPAGGAVVDTVLLANPPRGVTLSDQGLYVAVRSTGAEHRGGELRVQPADSMDAIDPALAYSQLSWSMLTMTNDGLVTFRKVAGVEGTQIVPDLAVALPSAADGGKTYTFEVRRGIRYSNGRLVQPEDFRHALERVFELGSPVAGYYAGIVGATRCTKGKPCNLARGITTNRAARTVTIRLTAPDADFLLKLALPATAAVPATTPAGGRTSPLPATGPYRIASYDKTRKTLRLVRNRAFREWSADAQPQGFPDSIRVSWSIPFDNTAGRVRAVEDGKADVAPGGGPPLPKEELERLAVSHGSQLHVTPELSMVYFFFNTRVAPFSDRRARRAVSIAFDRDDLAKAVGRAGTPTCRVLPRNFPGFRPTCPGEAGGVVGLDEARQLVRRSGTAGARVAVWTPSAAPPEVNSYMVSLLNSLGYRARLNDTESGGAEYFNMVADPRTRAQIGFGAWALDYPSSADFIRPLLSCAAYVPASPAQTTNLTGFCDPAIDAQMTRASATQVHDPAAATAIWQRVEDALLDHAPLLPAYNRTYVTFVSPRVGNYQYNPQWGVLLSQLWVK
jgi:YVTN family beta-propeller protein